MGGSGCAGVRERQPGVWEIRVVVAKDQVSGRSVQRSFTVHGDADLAEDRRRDLVERFALDRSALYCQGARLTLAELLERFVASNDHWRPATRSSNTSVARFLICDPVGDVGLATLSPGHVEAAISRWRAAAASPALVWGRWAVLRRRCPGRPAAVSCAPTRWTSCGAPPRPLPRKHLLPSEVAALLATAAAQVDLAAERVQAKPGDGQLLEALFVAEQTQLLVRLAADTGAAGASSPRSA